MNLHMLHNDPYFPLSLTEPTFMIVTEEFRNNPFVVKRFSKDILDAVEVIEYIPLHKYDFLGFLIFLYCKNPSQQDKSDNVDVDHYMKNVIPLIKVYFTQETISDINEQIVTSFVNSVKTITHAGVDRATIVHFYLESPIDLIMFDLLTNYMITTITEHERLLYISPMHIAVILSTTLLHDIEGTIIEYVGKVTIEKLIFPNHGKTIINYL